MGKKLLIAFFAFAAIGIKAQLYYENVASIFTARCNSCHNKYGHADFVGYSKVTSYATTIVSYLQSGYMPPWPPDTTYTRFAHERLITTAEKNTLINWINGGMQYIDTTQAPPDPQYPQYKLNGTPSLVLSIGSFVSNATSADKYNCFAIPSGLTQDVYLRAFEIVPGDPTIVHHVVVNIDTTGSVASDLSGGCFTEPGQFSIGGYAPGATPTIFPSGSNLKLGMRIKAGSKVILQIHYPKGTGGSIDSTKIRMYFYPSGTTGIRPLIAKTSLQNWTMSIAANTTATYTAQTSSLSAPLSIYSTFPHSHKICTKITNWADQNGTNTIPLIRINKWDFNWQDYYTFHYMVKVPAGYRLKANHFYDNTTNNPNNPNPTTVTAGFSTTNEMLFDAFMYTNYQAGDENINIDTLLMNDSLLVNNNTTAVNSVHAAASVKVEAYPNPFSDKINLAYELVRPAFVSVSIFNIFGQEVAKITSARENTGVHRHEWDGRTNGVGLPAGAYTYKVTIDNSVHTGKIILKSKN